MKNLRNSILLLLAYLFLVLGIAQIQTFEEKVLYFQPAFFILMTLSVFAGVFPMRRFRPSLYSFLTGWAIVSVLVWGFYLRLLPHPQGIVTLMVQFLLAEVAAGLAHNLGTDLIEFDVLFEGLSASTYPNRTLDMNAVRDRIAAEMTRSRRYNRPMSVLVLQLQEVQFRNHRAQLERLEQDLFSRFALAKVGQIIDGRARQTDLVMRDGPGRFIILCPETDSESSAILAERIRSAVESDMGDVLTWGAASFPQETLAFDDLVKKAADRLGQAPKPATEVPAVAEEAPVSADAK